MTEMQIVPPSRPPAPLRTWSLALLIEQIIFASRWLLAPLYLGLIGGLLLLLVKFCKSLIELAAHLGSMTSDHVIMAILELIDITLMGGLVLMVMFAGYENFVSKIHVGNDKDRPAWMGKIDFGDLKLKLMASIVAISAIHVLEDFMNIADLPNRDLAWSVGMHGTFVLTGVLLAVMDKLAGKHA